MLAYTLARVTGGVIRNIFVTKHNFQDRTLIHTPFFFFFTETTQLKYLLRGGWLVFTMSDPKLQLRGKGRREWPVRQTKCKYILMEHSLGLGDEGECSFWDGCTFETLRGSLYLPLTVPSIFFFLRGLFSTFLLRFFFLYLLAVAPRGSNICTL